MLFNFLTKVFAGSNPSGNAAGAGGRRAGTMSSPTAMQRTVNRAASGGRTSRLTGADQNARSRRNAQIAQQFSSNAYTRNGRRTRGAGAVRNGR